MTCTCLEKLTARIAAIAAASQLKSINPVSIATHTFDAMTQRTVDYCESQIPLNAEYKTLASRLSVAALHKTAPRYFTQIATLLFRDHIVHKDFFAIVEQHGCVYESIIDYTRDYDIDYWWFKIMLQSYLHTINGVVIERPQHLWMRAAVLCHANDFHNVKHVYEILSREMSAGQRDPDVKRAVWDRVVGNKVPYMLKTVSTQRRCVASDTLVLTDEGYMQISTLENKMVHVWNGDGFIRVKICKTGQMQPLMRVYFNNGLFIDCTRGHGFYIHHQQQSKDALNSELTVVKVDACDLVPGQTMIHAAYPIINATLHSESVDIDKAYKQGVFFKCMHDMPHYARNDVKMAFFSGFCDTFAKLSGCVLEVVTPEPYVATKLLLLLQTCGLNPPIIGDTYCVVHLCAVHIKRLCDLGFKSRLLENNNHSWKNSLYSCYTPLKIQSIDTVTQRVDDVFSFNDRIKRMALFNGVLVGN